MIGPALSTETRGRYIAATVLMLGALVLSLVFYGTTVNLLILAMVAAALLTALVCIGPRRIVAALQPMRRGWLLVALMLGYLAIAYRLSLSPATSFGPSWVLAAGPLAFVAATAVFTRRDATRLLLSGVFGVVLLLSAVSAARFLLYGERAREPLLDANDYAALIYLVWIPFVHTRLVRAWRGGSGAWFEQCAVGSASFLMLLTILATGSRTAALIVLATLLVWSVFTTVRRLAWRPLLIQIAVVGVALTVWIGRTHVAGPASYGTGLAGGVEVRMELIRAAIAMFAQHPFGIGVFCFSLLYPSYRSPLEQDTAGLFVHNDYVQLLAEAGVPALLLLLAFVVAIVLRAGASIRAPLPDRELRRFGIAMALAAVCAHAAINFVFYSLPLVILIGMMAARLFAPGDGRDESILVAGRSTGLVAAALTAGWLIWSYLLLDVVVAGVFQNQPSLPFVSSIRTDETRMLHFARVAQRLNSNRGEPVFAEAILLYRATRREPDSRYLRAQTYATFRRALAIDPWNSMIYLRLAQFLDEFPPPRGRPAADSDEVLLSSAIGLDPLFLQGVDKLLALFAHQREDGRRYALLRNIVYPWMTLIRRRDPNASDRYFALLESYASAAGDAVFLAELQHKESELKHLAPIDRSRWFF